MEKSNIVEIGNKKVGYSNPCLISFEPSATYTDLSSAKKMIKYIAESGANGVKFQTFLPGDAERMMAKKDITVDFTTETGKKQELVLDALKRRELTESEWIELIEYSKEQNLLFITAPYFSETIDFLKDLKIDAFKVSKGDINNVLLIDSMAKTKIPIILDAREKISDVDKAVHICENQNNKNIIVMHCPSGYPANNVDVHLNAIQTLQKRFSYPIAFADHSLGDFMNYAAIGIGAKFLEKTITSDKTIEKVEHSMSLELEELKQFVKNIRSIEEAMGNSDILQSSRVEENARRSIVAKLDIKKGEKIIPELLDFRRPGNAGISCSEGFSVIDKRANQNIQKNTFLQWNMLD